MLPEETGSVEEHPLSGSTGEARHSPPGPLALAKSLSPIASSALLFLIVVLLAVIIAREQPSSPAISQTSSSGKCFAFTPQPGQYAPHTPILLRNGTVWTGTGSGVLSATDLLLENGRISKIGSALSAPAGAQIIDVNGAFVTPGLIDLHSHVGDYPWPADLFGPADGNEMTNPTFPQVRALDAFDTADYAIPWVRAGGVTTLQVLPGSGNAIGGEGFGVKLKPSATVGPMLLQGGPSAMKMATGENPKRVYGSMDRTPMSRMGTAWLLRQQFAAASDLKRRQDAWCSGGNTGAMPADLALQPLVDILRGQRRLNIHSYEVVDMETCIRISQEFGFKISAFHHALEAWMIPDLLKANNITVATFTDLWGFKWEAYDASVYGPKILSDAGVKTCLKSDHPVTDSHYLMYMAAKAWHWGMKEDAAIASVTSVPAAAMGYDYRMGSIAPNMDADIVVWDRHPLLLGARPQYVFIEGVNVVSNSYPLGPNKLPVVSGTLRRNGNAVQSGSMHSASYSLEVATVWDMNSRSALQNANIVVLNGVVSCVGPASSCPVPANITDRFQLAGAVVTPGLVEANTRLGQSDIEMESVTQDGVAGVDGDAIYAADGIAVQSKHTTAAFLGGVTTSINGPMGSKVIGGFGVAFHTHGVTILDALVQRVVGLHVAVGVMSKSSGPYSSISGQMSVLRSRFIGAQAELNSTTGGALSSFAMVLKGEIPLVAHADEADPIAALLTLKADFGFNLIIVGGTASIDAGPCILLHPLCHQPLLSLTGVAPPNLTRISSALWTTGVLYYAAVFEFRPFDPGCSWSEAWAVEYGLSYVDALAAVTSNIADIFGVPGIGRIKAGQIADLVVYDGEPLSLAGRVQLVALRNHLELKPQQF